MPHSVQLGTALQIRMLCVLVSGEQDAPDRGSTVGEGTHSTCETEEELSTRTTKQSSTSFVPSVAPRAAGLQPLPRLKAMAHIYSHTVAWPTVWL